MRRYHAVVWGVCAGILSSFPTVWIMGEVYRFPSWGDYTHSWNTLTQLVNTWLLWGLFWGGFPLVGLLGGFVGARVYDALKPDSWGVAGRTALAAFCIDLAAVWLAAVWP